MKLFIHQSPNDVEIPVRLRFGAVALIGRDLFSLYSSIVDYLATLNFEVKEEKISRVDLQVMVDVETSDFVFPVLEGCLVCKAIGSDTIYRESVSGQRKITSYTIGSDIQLCIYDKRLEMEKSMLVSDPVKYQLMINHCLGEKWLVTDTPLTRVEFRLRRAALSDLSINSVDDLFHKENSLVNFLTHNWFRAISKNPFTNTPTSDTITVFKFSLPFLLISNMSHSSDQYSFFDVENQTSKIHQRPA